jgi:hypothetical protein
MRVTEGNVSHRQDGGFRKEQKSGRRICLETLLAVGVKRRWIVGDTLNRIANAIH